MKILNVHERRLPATLAQAGALLDRLAAKDDPLWPWERWTPLKLDGPLAVGARGGHGPVRYHVGGYEPGRSVTFEFEPRGLVAGFHGHHRFEVVPAVDGCVLRHVIDVRSSLGTSVKWLLFVRALHDALLEDALDKAERAVTGTVRSPAEWSPWVSWLRRIAPRGPARG